MQPTIGRIVHYRLSTFDAQAINKRRADFASAEPAETGFQAHVGNHAEAGQIFPAVIVRIFGNTPASAVNLQVFLDGNDSYWATSRTEGDGDGLWFWPPQV